MLHRTLSLAVPRQAAVTGWAYVSSGGPLFPGYLSIQEGVTFESLGRDGYAAWDAVSRHALISNSSLGCTFNGIPHAILPLRDHAI